MSGLSNKLQERRDLFDKKACLVLFLNVSQSVNKIEKLLNINPTQHLHPPDLQNSSVDILMKDDESTSNLIERVASELNQLKFYVSRGKTLPFVKKMEPRIAFIENNLKNGLERLFHQGLQSKNLNIISNCLRTYAAIDKVNEAENLFRQWVVLPLATKVPTSIHHW